MSLFGENLKMARELKGITRTEMAYKIGMSAFGYALYENGKRQPNLEKLVIISQFLGVSIDELLGISADHRDKNKFIKYISSKLTKRERLEQLAEECCELGQASLKLIRAAGMSDNLTTVSENEAFKNLNDELMDVICAAYVVKKDSRFSFIEDYWKYRRWAERLGWHE